MKLNRSALLMILAGALLLLLFILPMWRISLFAPQYPDGVHMFIYINEIGGSEPGTLQNINILNHYVGMKYIEPDSIPELTYFPYVVIGFTLLAFAFAAMNRKWGYAGWLILFTVALGLALYDFYLWEYDYGHNLDPNAIMKFEGQSFQPPLIGKKNLLNFVAISYPHTGGYAIIASWILASVATWLSFKRE